MAANPIKAVIGLALAVFLGATLMYWPNWWKDRVLGPDTPPGGEIEEMVRRRTQTAQCNELLKKMGKTLKECRKLDAESKVFEARLAALKRNPKVDRQKLDESGIEELVTSLRTGPDEVSLQEFEAQEVGIRLARQELVGGKNPMNYESLIVSASKNLKAIEEENARRKDVAKNLREKFAG